MKLSEKLIVSGGILSVFGITMKWFIFNEIFKIALKDQTVLKEKSEIRGIYLKIPFPLDFKIYFFNVSNPMEVQNGGKPVLREVGPYVYDEFVEKINVADNESEDTLTYSPFNTFQFNAEKTGRLSENDYVTIIHPLIVGMVNSVTKESPALLSIVNKALIEIFNNPESMYLTGTVKEILFDGFEVNCNAKEFPAKAVCSQLRQQIPGLKVKDDPKVFYFSLLGPRNATVGPRYKVKRGMTKLTDLGRLMEIDGEKRLKMWSTLECNEYHGTDGWIFPPMLTAEAGLVAFSSDLCRSIKAEFIEDVKYRGLNLRKYEGDLGNMQENEDEKCYCETPDTCMKKGVFDLTKCMGVPIYASLPHFLKADEIFLNQVDGLHPDYDNHSLRILLEPLTSSPISARKRIQLNLQVSPNPKITLMQNISESLHPIFWLEEGVELEGPLFKKVKGILTMLPIVGIVFWLMILGGFGTLGYGAYLHYKNQNTVEITPVREMKNGDNQIIVDNNDTEDKKKSYVNHAMSGHEFDRY